MSNLDLSTVTVYDETTLDHILKEVHQKSKSKDLIISAFITKLVNLVETADSAALLAPLISDYFEVSVKNDDQLIKLAGIIQRIIKGTASTESGGDSLLLTEYEKQELLAASAEYRNENRQIQTIEIGKENV